MNRPEMEGKVDIIITSPPYNTSRVNRAMATNPNDLIRKPYDFEDSPYKYHHRYDLFIDHKTDDEYINWTLDIFKGYDKVLKPNGCVLYNLSYSSEKTHLIWITVADIIKNTNFTTADCIIWKKSNAIPNNSSKNKLTRIIEYVFVFVRKSEIKTFHSNKKVVSRIERTGQALYENIQNIIEAKNNDGTNPLNKATFSQDLVGKLLKIYAKPNSLVYDSFMGIGTTAKAAINMGMEYVGSEISKLQCDYFEEWKSNQILNNN